MSTTQPIGAAEGGFETRPYKSLLPARGYMIRAIIRGFE